MGADLAKENEWLLENSACDPPCTEYFHSMRMPEIYSYFDLGVCIIFAFEYSIKIYVTQKRCQFFIHFNNLVDLFFIILPPILFRWNDTSAILLCMLAASRLLRIKKAVGLLYLIVNTKENEVAK